MTNKTGSILVCALYHFVPLEDCKALGERLRQQLGLLNIKGTVLVAREGINGTIAGSRESVTAFRQWLQADPRFAQLTASESFASELPFYRTKVKVKQEIVTLGVPELELGRAGKVQPGNWNALLADPETTLIDTRNEYEIRIGTFLGATNPHTGSFREFPEYAAKQLHPEQHKKIAMFCTGGIRCEKSTAYLKARGFPEVYHLAGGILNYLETVPEAESLWQGECFVFDNRVTVNHQLQAGSYTQCHACRMPITAQDRQQPAYVQGVSCPHCINRKSESARARFREREKQMRLAAARGKPHLGSDAQ